MISCAIGLQVLPSEKNLPTVRSFLLPVPSGSWCGVSGKGYLGSSCVKFYLQSSSAFWWSVWLHFLCFEIQSFAFNMVLIYLIVSIYRSH